MAAQMDKDDGFIGTLLCRVHGLYLLGHVLLYFDAG